MLAHPTGKTALPTPYVPVQKFLSLKHAEDLHVPGQGMLERLLRGSRVTVIRGSITPYVSIHSISVSP